MRGTVVPTGRGIQENANGLLRECFPTGTDFSIVADEEVAQCD